MDFFIFIFFFLLLFNLPTSRSQEEYTDKCQKPFTCGLLANLSYPFWGGNRPSTCGHPDFKLNCEESKYPLMVATQQYFRVLKVNLSSVSMTIARDDYFSNDGICQINPSNTTLDATILTYNPSGFQNISIFYNCTQKIIDLVPESYRFACPGDGFIANVGSSWDDAAVDCETRVDVPIQTQVVEGIVSGGGFSVAAVLGGLRKGFNVSYGFDCLACWSSGGSCVNVTGGGYLPICDKKKVKRKHSNQRKRIIGIVSGVVGALLLIPLAWIICQLRKRRRYAPSSYASRSILSDPSSRSDVEKGSRYMGAPLFTYTELADATNNFDERKELGDGGFGTVYYGKLKDGREVAVKRLYENNYRRVEQFMNEVDILTRLQHKNLVILYGCTSRHSRELLLVYEYIENGTVADHLHGVKARPGSLPWPLRLNIAVETARALTYLHASDIIHRDVKTNNILLDKNFCVKVADFGLSRLFPMDVTHISTAPQGTPGYVDPEYHQYYQLTNKSDVYSFGVVLAELISSLPAVDITRHRHEINLFNMAINKIQRQALHEFVDPSLGFSSDETMRKSISAVAELAFQCLQSAKELRPTMNEVLETLTTLQGGKRDPDQSLDNDTTSDDVGLLKYGASPLSPVSVTAKWSSSSGATTPNTSS